MLIHDYLSSRRSCRFDRTSAALYWSDGVAAAVWLTTCRRAEKGPPLSRRSQIQRAIKRGVAPRWRAASKLLISPAGCEHACATCGESLIKGLLIVFSRYEALAGSPLLRPFRWFPAGVGCCSHNATGDRALNCTSFWRATSAPSRSCSMMQEKRRNVAARRCGGTCREYLMTGLLITFGCIAAWGFAAPGILSKRRLKILVGMMGYGGFRINCWNDP